MIEIHLARANELTEADWQLWNDIVRDTPVYQCPYFRPEFTLTVAAVRDDVEIAILADSGETAGFFPFQRGNLGLGKPVGGKLSDYHGPIVRAGLDLDPRQLLRGCKLACWDFDHLVCPTPAFEPFFTSRGRSPQLDLRGGYDAYVRARREAGSDVVARTGQKARKLAREVGPLSFTFAADEEEAFELLLAWKSAQYEKTGLANLFEYPWTLDLLKRLRNLRGEALSAPLSVLRAGDQVAPVMLSLRTGGILHAWFPAYNPALAGYSPGVTILLQMAVAAPALGIHTLDLGRGEERYKWSLASGSQEVCEGTVALPSFSGWLRGGWRRTRDWVRNSPLKEPMALPARLIKPIREWMAYH
jgi:CelD/BcsL family acetyltransferase involved in cellulose biosynthesis